MWAQSGWTALHIAADMGRLEIVQALVDRGADMRTPTKRGMTALDLAIDKGATEVVRWFTDYNVRGLLCRAVLHGRSLVSSRSAPCPLVGNALPLQPVAQLIYSSKGGSGGFAADKSPASSHARDRGGRSLTRKGRASSSASDMGTLRSGAGAGGGAGAGAGASGQLTDGLGKDLHGVWNGPKHTRSSSWAHNGNRSRASYTSRHSHASSVSFESGASSASSSVARSQSVPVASAATDGDEQMAFKMSECAWPLGGGRCAAGAVCD